MAYQHPQPYPVYEHQQWQEDLKPIQSDAEFDPRRDPHAMPSTHTTEFGPVSSSRRQSMLKVEEEFSRGDQVWHDRRVDSQVPMRHYSQPTMPTQPTNGQPYGRVDPNFLASYAQPAPPWAMSQSGTSTPTPTYAPTDAFAQPVQYAPHPTYAPMYTQDPLSAVSMSPQSSQGGWPSAASNDSAEQAIGLQSPSFRPVSPHMVMRPDGIRKKNARFDIPRERNLQTIDALILASTDENEKKELKQQKRLLRNRQAALDSRQRKKTHTEKLEQEKKVSEKRLYELEDTITSLENTLQHERDQWLQQRSHFEIALHQMQLERDEAIRQKTMETGELRRQIGALKDVIRDLERQHSRPAGYNAPSDVNGIATDFSELIFEDDAWETEFSLIDSDDLKMDDSETVQRQSTPKPAAPTMAADHKSDTGFTKNAALMCLLVGAHVASKGNMAITSDLAQAVGASSLDNYRAEASNVLKTVLASNAEVANEIVPSILQTGHGNVGMHGHSDFPNKSVAVGATSSNLDQMTTALTTPSRQQELQATFSLPASSLNQIMGDMNDDDADADLIDSPRPSRLEQAFAEHQARQKEKETAAGVVNKVDQRSLLMDRVPEDVLRHFKDFVKQSRSTEHIQQQ